MGSKPVFYQVERQGRKIFGSLERGHGFAWINEFSSKSREETLTEFILRANDPTRSGFDTLRMVRVTENAKTVEKMGDEFIICRPGEFWPKWLN